MKNVQKYHLASENSDATETSIKSEIPAKAPSDEDGSYQTVDKGTDDIANDIANTSVKTEYNRQE